MIIRRLNIAMVFFLLTLRGFAQTSDKAGCINNLSAANTLYEKAQFAEAVAILEPCTESGKFSKHAADAYRILGLCYQQMNNEVKTNQAVSHLLRINPKYQKFPYNDPKEFTQWVNTFTVESKINLGVKTGFNFSLPTMTKAFSIKPATIEIQSERGQFIGLYGDYFFKEKRYGINAWTTANALEFSQTVRFNDVETIQYSEEFKQVDVGLEFKAFLMKKAKIRPYIGLGLNALILRSAISNIVYTNAYLETKTESSRDMKDFGLVRPVIFNGIADCGINTNAGKGIFGLGVQYAYAFTLSNDPGARYDNIDYALKNQWVDSDIKLNYLTVYASYSFPLLWRVYKN